MQHSAHAPEPLEDQLVLESLLSRGNPKYKATFPLVVIYFTASWCRACRAVSIPELMGLRQDIKWYKCDVDDNQYSPSYCGVSAIPAFQAIVNGVPLQLMPTSDMGKLREFVLGLRA